MSVEEKRRALLELRMRQRAIDTTQTSPANTSSSNLVTLTADGPLPPIFFIHPASGSAAPYITLAAEFGSRRPVHALEAYGIHSGTPLERIEDLAERHIDEIRRVRARGPYHLGGWSIGGMIALEIAIQLRDLGEDIAVLLLLDTTAPWSGDPPHHVDILSSFAYEVAALQNRSYVPLDRDHLLPLDPAQRLDAVADSLERANLVPSDLREQTLRRMRVFVANWTAYTRYRPTPYGGPIDVIAAQETAPENLDQWRRLALPRLCIQTVPGTHYNMLQAPRVATVAATVNARLDQAR